MRTLTDRIRAFPNENCNKTNLTYIRVLSTSVQLQQILKIYLTAVMVVQVHGSVYFFLSNQEVHPIPTQSKWLHRQYCNVGM